LTRLVANPAGETNANLIARTRHEYTVALDVATFTVTRLSPVTISAQIGMERLDTLEVADVSPLCASTTFLAPGANVP
jgi:hypothetical protein